MTINDKSKIISTGMQYLVPTKIGGSILDGNANSQRNNKGRRSSPGMSNGSALGPGKGQSKAYITPPGLSSLVERVCPETGLPFLGIRLMQMIATIENLEEAFRILAKKDGSHRLIDAKQLAPQNLKGKKAAGIDGKSIIKAYQEFWINRKRIIKALLNGQYLPSPVKRVYIPKGKGKQRPLGIPTAMDRAVQMAILLVLNSAIDRFFCDQSHGFRPRRSVHTAVSKVREAYKRGLIYAVSIDLKGFFDQVPHKPLMKLVRRMTADSILLGLIKRFLKAGVWEDGKVHPTDKGTPQGGVISPILANLYLHLLDIELVQRNLQHVRYADDFIIFAKSRRAAVRIMRSVKKYLEEVLLLPVNEEKSQVVKICDLEYLSFGFKNGKLRIAQPSLLEFKSKVRCLCQRDSDRAVKRSMRHLQKFLTGWLGHYSRIDAPDQCRDLDKWYKEHINSLLLNYRGSGPDPMQLALGIWSTAMARKRAWREAIGSPDPNSSICPSNATTTRDRLHQR